MWAANLMDIQSTLRWLLSVWAANLVKKKRDAVAHRASGATAHVSGAPSS